MSAAALLPSVTTFDLICATKIQCLFRELALYLGSEPAATALLLALLSLPLVYVQERRSSASGSPWWTSLLLVLDSALEYPFILRYHPVTLIYPTDDRTSFASIEQLVLQVLAFFVVEQALKNCVLQFVRLPGRECGKAGDGAHDAAETLVLDFIRSRGTLLLAIALLGMPSALGRFTGQLHPLAVVGWSVAQQVAMVI